MCECIVNESYRFVQEENTYNIIATNGYFC